MNAFSFSFPKEWYDNMTLAAIWHRASNSELACFQTSTVILSFPVVMLGFQKFNILKKSHFCCILNHVTRQFHVMKIIFNVPPWWVFIYTALEQSFFSASGWTFIVFLFYWRQNQFAWTSKNCWISKQAVFDLNKPRPAQVGAISKAQK